ncbi:YybH family protein [Sorangium sp. So ce136]|uniref:YybH family protein n=1 Tax=Sorangium sp. So ce136 TaxID=3133284 RepID=UPI003F51F9FF
MGTAQLYRCADLGVRMRYTLPHVIPALHPCRLSVCSPGLATGRPDADELARLVLRFCDAFNRENLDEAMAYFHENAVYVTLDGKRHQGLAAIREDGRLSGQPGDGLPAPPRVDRRAAGRSPVPTARCICRRPP